jgi:nitric oxide reductase subunit B
MRSHFSISFIVLGLVSLIIGSFIGLLLSIVYIEPDFLEGFLPYNQLRPMHTTSVVSWIILASTGGLYFYLSQVEKIRIRYPFLGKSHLWLFVLTGIAIYWSYITGNMGGREYLEYLPILSIPILFGWVLFGINYYSSLHKKIKDWPVFYWMWGVGILFMIYHLAEAHFWIFTDIRIDYIKDLTIQWKSYGSFVGCWNLLVYGTAIYIMAKVKGDLNLARDKKVFFFFFLSLANLMFGWAHHTYIIPTQPWVRYVAYGISMTEWIILLNIIFTWVKSLNKLKKIKYRIVYRFLVASELWVFLNLILALLMSIPAINYYTHGTHITVAHSMGTTIGINTMILLGSITYIVQKLGFSLSSSSKHIMAGYYLLNGSLLIFWLFLIIGGVCKVVYLMNSSGDSHADLHGYSTSIFTVVSLSGGLLLIGLLFITFPLLDRLTMSWISGFKNNRQS